MPARRTTRVWFRAAAGALGLLLAAVIVVAAVAVRPANPAGVPRVIVIPQGATSSDIGRQLEAAGVVRRAADFVITVRVLGLQRSLQGGEYLLSPQMGLMTIVRTLARGQVLLHSVTIPEGYTAGEIADLLAEKGLGERDRLHDLVRRGAPTFSHAFLRGVPTGSLEGYLFPETYLLPRSLPERDLLGHLLDRFGESVVPLWTAQGDGRSLHELITMASLVEREARVPDERALIAGVLYNRLRSRMRLEVDATVLYALGRHKSVVTYDDLKVDSPYNTYLHFGLPPGPIASPGYAAIQAALRPAKTDYLFYVARPDGSHVFSRTYAEHLAAIQKYRP